MICYWTYSSDCSWKLILRQKDKNYNTPENRVPPHFNGGGMSEKNLKIYLQKDISLLKRAFKMEPRHFEQLPTIFRVFAGLKVPV